MRRQAFTRRKGSNNPWHVMEMTIMVQRLISGNEEPSNFGEMGEQEISPDMGPEKEGTLDS